METVCVGQDLDQTGTVGGLECRTAHDHLEQPHPQRLAERDHLGRRSVVFTQPSQTGLDHLGEPDALSEGSSGPPQLTVRRQGPLLQGADRQLSEEQRVAPA